MSITYDGTIYEELSVDVSQQNEFAPRLVKQGDAYTRGYIITLTENGEPLTIPTANTTAWFNCRNKTDETKRASATGTINSNGTVTVKVPTVVMEVAGFIQCDVSIITASGNDTNILKSTLFYLNCEEAANPNGTTTAAEDSILAGIAVGTIVPPAAPYVPKTRKITDELDLHEDITTEQIKHILNLDDARLLKTANAYESHAQSGLLYIENATNPNFVYKVYASLFGNYLGELRYFVSGTLECQFFVKVNGQIQYHTRRDSSNPDDWNDWESYLNTKESYTKDEIDSMIGDIESLLAEV